MSGSFTTYVTDDPSHVNDEP